MFLMLVKLQFFCLLQLRGAKIPESEYTILPNGLKSVNYGSILYSHPLFLYLLHTYRSLMDQFSDETQRTFALNLPS